MAYKRKNGIFRSTWNALKASFKTKSGRAGMFLGATVYVLSSRTSFGQSFAGYVNMAKQYVTGKGIGE